MAQRTRTRAISLVIVMLLSLHLSLLGAVGYPDDSILENLEEPAAAGTSQASILIYGNSYTSGNNLAGLVQTSIQNHDSQASVTSRTGGGMNLDDHASNAQTAGHQWNTTLANGNWDWVILQDQSQVPSFPTTSQYWQDSKAGAIALDGLIEDNGAQTVFLMTWGRRNGDSQNAWRNPDFLTMQGHLEAGYGMYAENVTSSGRQPVIAPAGLAFKWVYQDVLSSGTTPENPGNRFYDLYTSDGSHPSLSGSYLTACVIDATLSGVTPVGNSHPSGISATDALYLQKAAADTVFNLTQNLVYPWQSVPWSFGNGQTSVQLFPAANDSTTIPHQPGSRVAAASFEVTAHPFVEWSNSNISMLPLALTSTFNNSSVDANGNLRLNVSSAGGTVPNVGTNNTQIHQSVQWASGNYSFDTFRLACIGSTCGQIQVSGGPLRIYANTIIIDQGAEITADEMVWGNSGSGTSSQRGANGKSPGAGGAGHGSNGGAGGGTNGGTGGSSYGNGSEPGSSGGNVTFTNSQGQTSVDAQGGRGGGVVELVARTIYVNGTVSVNGGRGTNGAPPASGTGPGGSGAGGGSGGSIALMANTVLLGNSGELRADGGNGGNGANGAQNGPGIGMFDGGNGGGGGAGGMVLVATRSGQFTNNGAMTAYGGNGGARGSPYGTGSYGQAGNAGYAGFAFSGTFAGWAGSSTYHPAGSFESPTYGEQGVIRPNGSIAFHTSIPANTSIDGFVQHTLDGVSWSQWEQMNLSGETLPPHMFVRYRIELETANNTTSPHVSRMIHNHSNWGHFSNLSFSVANHTLIQPYSNLAHRTGSSSSSTSHHLTANVTVPVTGVPIDSAWIHVKPPSFTSSGEVTVMMGTTQLLAINSSDLTAVGIAVEVPKSVLAVNWPSTGAYGPGGVEHGLLQIDVNTNASYTGQFSVGAMTIPYMATLQFGDDVYGNLSNVLSQYVTSEVGGWEFADMTEFPLNSTALGNQSHYVWLSNLQMTFVDDLIPEVTNISFLVDGQARTYARVGELVEIRVKVLANESQLDAEWHFEDLSSLQGWPPQSLSPLTWDAASKSYVGFYDTSTHLPEYTANMAVWVWLEDGAGNQADPNFTDWVAQMELLPIFPEIDQVAVTGCDQLLVSTCYVGPRDMISFTIKVIDDRPDLAVFAYVLDPSDAERGHERHLHWNQASKSYIGEIWMTSEELGWWDVSFRAIDLDRAEQDWKTMNVTKVFVDEQRTPNEGSVTIEQLPAPGDWLVSTDWISTIADPASGTLQITGPSGFDQTIDLGAGVVLEMTQLTNLYLMGDTHLKADSSGNGNHTVSLVSRHLQERWPGIQVEDLTVPEADVDDFTGWLQSNSEVGSEQIFVIILDTDYWSSLTTNDIEQKFTELFQETSRYPNSRFYVGLQSVDPDLVCPASPANQSCHQPMVFEHMAARNAILEDLALTYSSVTAFHLPDDELAHPEWRDTDSNLTELGHQAMTEAVIRTVNEGQSWWLRNHSSTHSFSLGGLNPGTYGFELIVNDSTGDEAIDAKPGIDATAFFAPADDILSLSILTPVPSILHPGNFELTYDATCSIGCDMELYVYLDGGEVASLIPGQGSSTLTLEIPMTGMRVVTMVLSAPDWDVSSATDSIELWVTSPPTPDWHITCTSIEEEVTLEGVSYGGLIGDLARSTHTLDCLVTNSGDANGTVRLSETSSYSPFTCSEGSELVEPGGRVRFTCVVEESEENSGIYPISLAFEEVKENSNESIGGWETTSAILTPRFTSGEVGVLPDVEEPETGVELGGKSLLIWIAASLFLLVAGVGGITAFFTWRDREQVVIGEFNEDSLFGVSPPTPSTLGDELHPSLLSGIESISSIERVASYLDLPGGGEYQEVDGQTIYVTSDGLRWQMEEGGSFTRVK